MYIQEILRKHALWSKGEEGGERANLRGADLSGANLREADLRHCIGNMREIKSAQWDTYAVVWTDSVLAIGCQQHPIKFWQSVTDEQLADMASDGVEWWKRNRRILVAHGILT